MRNSEVKGHNYHAPRTIVCANAIKLNKPGDLHPSKFCPTVFVQFRVIFSYFKGYLSIFCLLYYCSCIRLICVLNRDIFVYWIKTFTEQNSTCLINELHAVCRVLLSEYEWMNEWMNKWMRVRKFQEISGGKFPVICCNLPENFRRFLTIMLIFQITVQSIKFLFAF